MGAGLTDRQEKWFASVRASLQRETGKTLEEWVAIARTCPETRPRARLAWFKANHGLGQNRASYVLSEAFEKPMGWDEPDALRSALWTDEQSRQILDRLEAAVAALPDTVTGQRKAVTAFSRKVQFAAARPVRGGKLMLGLAADPSVDARLEASKNEPWSDRLKARLLLEGPGDVARVEGLLRQAWERS